LLAADPHLVFEMDVRRRKEGVDARGGCWLDGAGGGFNVFPFGSGESCDARALNFTCYGAHRFEIAVGCDRKASLDYVHSQSVELVRQTQLFLLVHAAARRLLSISKSGVEDLDARALCGHGFPQKPN